MLEYGPIVILILVVAGVAVGLLPEAHDAPMRRFRNHCRAEGMSFAETEAAIATRMAFVRLRRLASDQCVSQAGRIGRDEINEIASRMALGLAAAHGHEAAKKFIAWIDDCPDEEILYDDARAARHRHAVTELRQRGLYPPKEPKFHDDHKHAFRIMKH
ncbi:hypothetical protein [Mesorhizobium sp. M1B.F.Ca.ET.045.04.1.1]|uniref:hypothetical protein n=1 Tax=Mesorhizobium sp. M1B.F.Ca.ET.045.04.1.1 TaxID=2493673 RepID=UPI000F75E6C7|nr:hypothetical protein [Mesorhizobium sp. M1B.F.Ca.ET.045.04.1.1]AZO29355.1 hypothetical protein EJ071_19510 [Mesorhizobium sp. M1B.F.Ca.ET.045.04.1.1]